MPKLRSIIGLIWFVAGAAILVLYIRPDGGENVTEILTKSVFLLTVLVKAGMVFNKRMFKLEALTMLMFLVASISLYSGHTVDSRESALSGLESTIIGLWLITSLLIDIIDGLIATFKTEGRSFIVNIILAGIFLGTASAGVYLNAIDEEKAFSEQDEFHLVMSRLDAKSKDSVKQAECVLFDKILKVKSVAEANQQGKKIYRPFRSLISSESELLHNADGKVKPPYELCYVFYITDKNKVDSFQYIFVHLTTYEYEIVTAQSPLEIIFKEVKQPDGKIEHNKNIIKFMEMLKRL